MTTTYSNKPLETEDAERVVRAFGNKDALIEFNPGKCLLPPSHLKIAQQILDAPVREDDVWLISYPRTGSTWCQEMVWLLGNDLDFETATNTIQQMRAPLIEMSALLFEYESSLGKELMENSVDFINNMPTPRYIKSHLPLQLLPVELDKVKPKIIYTCRNPKDMCVSYYYYSKMFHRLLSTFDEFCEDMLRGINPIGPVFNHYLQFWNKRHEPNVLFLMYEDMNKDVTGTLRKIGNFLGKEYTEEQYETVRDFLSIQKMRKNKGCNLEHIVNVVHGKDFYSRHGAHFFRKGKVGDWRNHFSPEMAKRFDDWIEENTRGTGLHFTE